MLVLFVYNYLPSQAVESIHEGSVLDYQASERTAVLCSLSTTTGCYVAAHTLRSHGGTFLPTFFQYYKQFVFFSVLLSSLVCLLLKQEGWDEREDTTLMMTRRR